MSNLGLRRALRAAGIDVIETPVGDRHVLAAMEARDLVLGGEQSGHIVYREDERHPRDHVRALDGLRGVPAHAHPRAVRPARIERAGRGRGHRVLRRIITSAAAIMVVVFGSFALTGVPTIKEVGVGLASAIAIDATITRLVLVPATMRLLGDWNWWLPGWLDRRLPQMAHEAPAAGD